MTAAISRTTLARTAALGADLVAVTSPAAAATASRSSMPNCAPRRENGVRHRRDEVRRRMVGGHRSTTSGESCVSDLTATHRLPTSRRPDRALSRRTRPLFPLRHPKGAALLLRVMHPAAPSCFPPARRSCDNASFSATHWSFAMDDEHRATRSEPVLGSRRLIDAAAGEPFR